MANSFEPERYLALDRLGKVAVIRFHSLREVTEMPWYWSDDVSQVLLEKQSISPVTAAKMLSSPVAYRSECLTVETAAEQLIDDGVIPLAA